MSYSKFTIPRHRAKMRKIDKDVTDALDALLKVDTMANRQRYRRAFEIADQARRDYDEMMRHYRDD